MKKIIFLISFIVFITSCQDKEKTEATSTGTDTKTGASANPSSVDLPYKASYSSNFTTDVSDADLKMVLQTYKDWEEGNISNLSKAVGDSIMVDFNNGEHFNGTNENLMKIWKTFRDSLSSVTIDMEAWQKMYEPDKKEAAIITWYKEIDTYKIGKVDSAYYHDINGIKNGKITFYSQFKRPAK